MSSDKTRAERIEEAATKFCDAARCSAVIGPHHEFQELEEALALPPDPPRCDGWEALEALKADLLAASAFQGDQHLCRTVNIIDHINSLLAAAPKEPEPADPRCESCGTTGDTVRTGDEVDLCEKCAKDIAESESPAALDHDMTMDEAEQLLAMTAADRNTKRRK